MLSDKIHVIELSHFIKLFFYSIQNRDNKVYKKTYEKIKKLKIIVENQQKKSKIS